MARNYPALLVRGADPDLLLAAVDDFLPAAVDERDGDSIRVFFSTSASRDAARDALASAFDVTAIEVPDEDWARRSQQNLQPIAVGRLTIVPNAESRIAHPDAIVIQPSMGFGTGHHATTRLCLAALQAIDVAGKFVLDVGTGSGVLAIAAARLGAARALGIDNDPDAVQSARENLALNPPASNVAFEAADLDARDLPDADIVTANLTGALLIRAAPRLRAAVRSRGTLIVSGLLAHERDDVECAFGRPTPAFHREEDGWLGLAFTFE